MHDKSHAILWQLGPREERVGSLNLWAWVQKRTHPLPPLFWDIPNHTVEGVQLRRPHVKNRWVSFAICIWHAFDRITNVCVTTFTSYIFSIFLSFPHSLSCSLSLATFIYLLSFCISANISALQFSSYITSWHLASFTYLIINCKLFPLLSLHFFYLHS